MEKGNKSGMRRTSAFKCDVQGCRYFWPYSVHEDQILVVVNTVGAIFRNTCVWVSSIMLLCVDCTCQLIHLRCFQRVVRSIHLTQTFLSTSLLTHTHFAFWSTYFHVAWDSDRDKQSGSSLDERQDCNPSLNLQFALISVYSYSIFCSLVSEFFVCLVVYQSATQISHC